MKKLLIGCGSIFAVFLLLGACVAVIGGGSNDTNNTPSTDKTDKKDQKSVAKIGDKVEAGKLAYQVESVEEKEELRNALGTKKPGSGKFLIVEVTVWNNDNEGRAVTESMTKLVDKDGNEYESSPDAMIYLEGQADQSALFDKINPKGVKRHTKWFTISAAKPPNINSSVLVDSVLDQAQKWKFCFKSKQGRAGDALPTRLLSFRFESSDNRSLTSVPFIHPLTYFLGGLTGPTPSKGFIRHILVGAFSSVQAHALSSAHMLISPCFRNAKAEVTAACLVCSRPLLYCSAKWRSLSRTLRTMLSPNP